MFALESKLPCTHGVRTMYVVHAIFLFFQFALCAMLNAVRTQAHICNYAYRAHFIENSRIDNVKYGGKSAIEGIKSVRIIEMF